MPKVRVLRAFRDGETRKTYRRGQEIEVAAKRAEFLAKAGYVELVQAKAKATATEDKSAGKE